MPEMVVLLRIVVRKGSAAIKKRNKLRGLPV